MPKLSKLQRRIRREANRLISRRRYRESHGGVKEPVWSIRKGPSAAVPKKMKIEYKETPKGKIEVPSAKAVKNILRGIRKP